MLLRLKPFGFRGHLLGTDELGRDILARILYGGRSSLLMGVAPVLFAGAVGGTLGVIAGYAGGWIGHAHHAGNGRVLRLPVRAAGRRHLGRHGRRAC